MIKCEVSKLSAVIDRQAEPKKGKDGQTFLSFSVKLPVEGRDGSLSGILISVSVDGDKGKAADLTVGRRVEIQGTLSPRKKGDTVFFNLRAEDVKVIGKDEADAIEGEMHFQGKIGKDRDGRPAVENRTDKKGNPFQTFSAYSSEKDGDSREYIWVRFLNFSPDCDGCVKAEAFIEVKGDLQLGFFNNKPDISCRVRKIQPWTLQNN